MKVVLICFQFSLLVGSLHGFAPPVTRLACTKCHWAVAGPAKEEKLTSEAVELLNALAARREAANQDETETPLLVAQVAPAVRYVWLHIELLYSCELRNAGSDN